MNFLRVNMDKYTNTHTLSFDLLVSALNQIISSVPLFGVYGLLPLGLCQPAGSRCARKSPQRRLAVWLSLFFFNVGTYLTEHRPCWESDFRLPFGACLILDVFVKASF